MKAKASTPAISRTRSTKIPAASPLPPGISRRDLRVVNRIAQAFGCLPVLPKSPRS